MLKLIFKLVPIERLMLITDSMAASWIGSGEVKLGGLDVLVARTARRSSNKAAPSPAPPCVTTRA